MRTICEALGSIRTKWHEVGVQLGVPYSKLEEFEKSRDPFAAVINYWLSGNVTESLVLPVSWDSIVTVLKSTYVSEPGLAETISKNYCQQEGSQSYIKNSSVDLTVTTQNSDSTKQAAPVVEDYQPERDQMEPGQCFH